jgi:hypothetical protein
MPKHGGQSREDLIERLEALRREPVPEGATEEARRLVEELKIHQIELEAQNRELREAQLLLESTTSPPWPT